MSDEHDEPKILAPDAPADTLHAHVQKHIDLPDDSKLTDEHEALMNEVTAHPNLGAHSITAMYNDAMKHTATSPLAAQGNSEPGNLSHEAFANLMKHPNTPADIKQDFALKTFHPENPHSDLHEDIANSGVLSDDQLRNMADQTLAAGEQPHAYEQLPAGYYLNHFKKAGNVKPETEEDEKLQKLGDFAWQGLMHSKKHTPETLDSTIDAIRSNKYFSRFGNEEDKADMFKDLVEARPDLSRDQINKIHQELESTPKKNFWQRDDSIDEVLKHPNVDPSLLAKYAVGKDVRGSALENPNLPKESIDAFVKRVKDPNEYSNRQNIQSLLENPNITKDHINALVARGSQDALHHPLADESAVRDSWNKSGKSLDEARSILQAKNTPPDVLKELVNYKNQDVAVSALEHPRADMDVVQEGLKRKAKTVQDAARLHPLVASSQVKEGLKSGKTSLSKAYSDPDFKQHFDSMSDSDRDEVFKTAHKKYAGSDLDEIAKKNKERTELVIHSKFNLASDPRVSQEVRDKNAKDLSEMFKDKVGKNKLSNTHAPDILSENHEEDSTRLIKAVADLAEIGDKHAQKAVLDNPAVLQQAAVNIDFENASPDFLESMFRKGEDYTRKGTQLYDRYGHPQKFGERTDLLSPIFDSKNLPENVFHEIASNKDLMEKIGNGDQFNRYNDLPEDQQNAKYRDILNSGSQEAAISVMRAKAPKESWDRAFGMLDAPQKNETLKDNITHVKSHRPDVFNNAVLGIYNEGNVNRGHDAQDAALENLKPDNLSDKEIIKQAISIPDSEPGGLADSTVLEHVPEKVFTDPAIIDHAIQANRPSLAFDMLGRRLNSQSEGVTSTENLGTDQARIAANKQKADQIFEEATQRVNSMPSVYEGGDNPIASNWNSLIDSAKTRYGDSHLFKNLRNAGVNLDFMADMPGVAGDALRKKALEVGLLSKDKLAQIAQTGSLDDVLAIGNPIKRQQALDHIVANPNITSEDLKKLTYRMNHTLLNPEAHEHGRRTSMSEDAYTTYQARLNKLVDLYQNIDPKQIPSMVFNAMKPEGKSKSDTLTNADTDRITKGTMRYVQSKPYANPHDKNMAIYQVYKGLGADNKLLQSQVEKSVFDTKDYETMVQMAEDRKLSDAGLSKLAKVVAQPGTLNSQQIAGLSTQLDSSSEPGTVVNMAKTFETKIAQEQEAAPGKDVSAQKIKFMTSLTSTFNPSSVSTEEDKIKNDFIINYTKKQTLDPKVAPVANTKLASLAIRMSAGDVDRAVDLMSSLPDDVKAFSTTNLHTTLPDKMCNSARFVEMAQNGWKLSMLATNASRLTGANASTLVDRALSEAGAHIDKKDLYSELESNEFVQPEDSVKVARAMSPDQFNVLMRNSDDDSMSGNMMFAAAARLTDLEAAVKDPNLVAQGAPYMGTEHRNHIMHNAEALSHVVKSASMNEDIANLGDKLSKVSDIINGVHGHVKAVADALRAEVLKSGYSLDHVGHAQQTVLRIADNIANTSLKLDRDDALKVMDMVKEFHSIEATAGQEPNPQASYKTISNIVQRAENFEAQDWKDTFTAAPHAVFQLAKRSEIPSAALESIDYKMFEDHPPRSKQENVQDAFIKCTADWFGMMSQADQITHGKNLMSMYVRMQNKGSVSVNNYGAAMDKSLVHMAKHMTDKDVQDLLQNTKDNTLKQNLYRRAVISGAGGKDTLHSFVRDYQKITGDNHELFRNVKEIPRGQESETARRLEPVTKSPHLDDELSGRVCAMFVGNPENMSDAMDDMLGNKNTPESAVKRVSQLILSNHKAKYSRFDERQSIEHASKLMSHPNIPEKELMEMFEISNTDFPKYIAPEGRFNPALQNPTHGGKLFRAMPVVVPSDVKNVDSGKAVTSISLQHKDYKKMQDIMSLIPPEGIAWAEFKRKYPQQEKGIPQAAKEVFMAGQNKPVMPEAFANAMRKIDDNNKKYHITFSHWTSPLQRHRGKDSAPNLVVHINNSAESEKELSQDPKLWSLYQQLLQQANGVKDGEIGLHPTTPHLVSWSRVDTDQGKGAWAIEEYQSDFAQKFRRNLKALISEFPSGTKINGQPITAEEMKKYSKVIDKHLDDWSEASMQAVIENAKAHGIKKLYMHGAELRGQMSHPKYTREFWDNKNTKPQTVGFRRIYDENPRKFGFQECDYTDYPQYSTSQLKQLHEKSLSSKCWVMDLAPDEGPKRKRKA